MAYMSEEGYKKLVAELQYLEGVRRPEIIQQIAEARDKGDLSENAEYDAAKEEQGHIESRIGEIEKILKNAEVVDDDADLEKVNVGRSVKIYDFEFDEELAFDLVGSTEADSLNNKISNEAPLGKALIGAKVGEVVEVELPDGIAKYKVLEIKRTEE